MTVIDPAISPEGDMFSGSVVDVQCTSQTVPAVASTVCILI
jgi:hypothetical protein